MTVGKWASRMGTEDCKKDSSGASECRDGDGPWAACKNAFYEHAKDKWAWSDVMFDDQGQDWRRVYRNTMCDIDFNSPTSPYVNKMITSTGCPNSQIAADVQMEFCMAHSNFPASSPPLLDGKKATWPSRPAECIRKAMAGRTCIPFGPLENFPNRSCRKSGIEVGSAEAKGWHDDDLEKNCENVSSGYIFSNSKRCAENCSGCYAKYSTPRGDEYYYCKDAPGENKCEKDEDKQCIP